MGVFTSSPLFGAPEQVGEFLVIGQRVDDDVLGVVELARHESAQVGVKIELRHQPLWRKKEVRVAANSHCVLKLGL